MSAAVRPPGGARVDAVVLAAGTSSRWEGDEPKQLTRWRGEPLVRRAVQAALASQVLDVVAVLGHRADAVEAALAGLPVQIVHNPDFATGQASSVRVGVGALPDDVDGALFIPCDQPLIDPSTLDLLIARFAALRPDRRGRAVVPAHRGRRGSPALIGRGLFGRLAALRGDAGGRIVFAELPDLVVEVELPSPDPLTDIDTLADLEALRQQVEGSSSDP